MQATIKTFTPQVVCPEIRTKIARAVQSSQNVTKRDLRCPYDGFRVGTVFADTGGHVMFKCRKCKREIVFKLTPGTELDFRRQ